MNIKFLQYHLTLDKHVGIFIFVYGHFSDYFYHDIVQLQDFLFFCPLFEFVFVVVGLDLVYFQYYLLYFQPVQQLITFPTTKIPINLLLILIIKNHHLPQIPTNPLPPLLPTIQQLNQSLIILTFNFQQSLDHQINHIIINLIVNFFK